MIEDWQLRSLVGGIMKPLREYGKRRQRNPEWKKFIGVCNKEVEDTQKIDSQLITLAWEVIDDSCS